MRVAMLSVHACPMARLGGRDSGGMNVYVREVARDIGSRGIEVDVFTRLREAKTPQVQQIAPNVRVIHIPAGPPTYLTKLEVFGHIEEFTSGLEAFVRAEGLRYDLIHSHYWLSADVARRLAPRWQVPVAQMFHTLGLVRREVLDDDDIDGESDVRIEIERQAMLGSTAIVAASEIEAGELSDLYGTAPEKIRIVPCGVDPEVFRPIRQIDARDALGVDQCERVILFVGRIEQIKGIDVLLRALGILLARHPELRQEVRLAVVGGTLDPEDDASEADKVDELRGLVHKHRMEANVEFLGSRTQEELALCYAAADICAVPSLTESFGLVALEAMACGTPVIATRVGGLQTVVVDGESGLLVPPGDDEALAAAMGQLLLNHRLHMHLAHGARDRAEHFTWRAVGEGIVRLYGAVLQARGAALTT